MNSMPWKIWSRKTNSLSTIAVDGEFYDRIKHVVRIKNKAYCTCGDSDCNCYLKKTETNVYIYYRNIKFRGSKASYFSEPYTPIPTERQLQDMREYKREKKNYPHERQNKKKTISDIITDIICLF